MLAAIALCAAAMVAMIVSVAGGPSDDARRSGAPISGDRLDMVSFGAPGGADRPIYRHSVIPGGVYTPDELRNVLVQDALAATHYQGLDLNTVRAETAKQDRFAYVSYRKDGQIFWTRNKVRLSEGETILTDGTQEIRARCGNCISETPQLPVAESEPDAAEFDQLVDDSHDPGDPFLSAAIRSALGSPSFGSNGGSERAGAVSESAGGASRGAPGSSAPIASGGSGGTGGIRPASVGSRGSSFVEPAGSPGGGGQPGAVPSSARSSSTGDSRAADPSSVGGSAAGAAGGSAGDTSNGPSVASAPISPSAPGTPTSPVFAAGSPDPSSAAIPRSSWALNTPHGPSTGSPGSDDPMPGPPFPESRFESPGTAASIPPGIDLPPGFNPAAGVQPSASDVTPSAIGSQDGSGGDPAGASLPEPGMLLLLGGGAAVALLRKLRSRH